MKLSRFNFFVRMLVTFVMLNAMALIVESARVGHQEESNHPSTHRKCLLGTFWCESTKSCLATIPSNIERCDPDSNREEHSENHKKCNFGQFWCEPSKSCMPTSLEAFQRCERLKHSSKGKHL